MILCKDEAGVPFGVINLMVPEGEEDVDQVAGLAVVLSLDNVKVMALLDADADPEDLRRLVTEANAAARMYRQHGRL